MIDQTVVSIRSSHHRSSVIETPTSEDVGHPINDSHMLNMYAMGGLAMIGVFCLMPQPLLAAGDDRVLPWSQEFWGNLWDPWFLFGMMAQAVFFMRFVVQWIVSERRKRSTIPIAFWYLSLAGGLATFVYACHEAQPVFMLGQLLACMIYIRNLMLIHGHADRSRKQGSRPIGELESEFGGENNGGSSG